jgi:hypothetical protein
VSLRKLSLLPTNKICIIKRSEEDIKESKNKKVPSISKAQTVEEIADFWDSHSLADFWDQINEVEFEVRAKRRRRITLTPEVYQKIAAQARAQGILSETLVNLWLAERLQG